MTGNGKSVEETPWEFYPDDDLREEPGEAIEDQAMHIEFVDKSPIIPSGEAPIVHYLDDEEPEIPDRSEPREQTDVTPAVDALLIQQHYIADDPTRR